MAGLPTILAQQDAAFGSSLVSAILFYGLALLAAVSAIGVLISRQVVRMAVCLLGALGAVAGLYLFLDAQFLAAVQLVIYVGGTLILITFGIMLTSQSAAMQYRPGRMEITTAVITGAVLCGALVIGLIRAFATPTQRASQGSVSSIQEIGQRLLGEFIVPFELISVLLLVVMIGAAFLARGRRPSARRRR